MFVLAAVFMLARFVFDLPQRTVVYGLIALGVAALGLLLAVTPAAQFVAVGLLTMLGGGLTLRRFLRENPSSDLPEPNAQGE